MASKRSVDGRTDYPTPRYEMPWVENPAYHGSEPPPFLVGDRALVAVPLHQSCGGGFDYAIIVATETGWDDSDGDVWSAWCWNAVSHYIPLDGLRKHEERSFE